MKKVIIFLFLIMLSLVYSQKRIKVVNIVDKKPIPHAEISCGTEVLGKTNQLGVLEFKTKCKEINVSAAGFYDEKYPVEKSILAQLSVAEKGVKKIEEVVILDKSDPRALALLKKVNDAFENNSPKSLDAYTYKSYDKIAMDMDKDTIAIYEEYVNRRIDSLSQLKTNLKDEKKIKDSLDEIKMMQVLKKSKFFLWERASEYLYSKKYGEKINILDNRVSGLQNPVYEMLAVRTNRNKIPYVVNLDHEKLYRYFLSDSISIDGRKTYVIKYREARKKRPNERPKFNGAIYIDAETYGIKKIETSSKKDNDAKVISIWKPISNKWFLEKEFIKLRMGSVTFDLPQDKKNPDENASKGKNEKSSEKEIDTSEKKKKPYKEFGNYVTLSSDYFDFTINEERDKKDFKGYALSVENSDGKILNQYRTTPLTERELETYKSIDSLGQKYKIDKKIQGFTALLRGKLRMGKVDLDLSKVVKVNNYEGFRMGAGFKMNERFNPYISPDFYVGYGFKDEGWKYGAGIDVRTTLKRHSIFRLEYANDVDAAGNFNRTLWDFKMQAANMGINLNNPNFHQYNGFKIHYERDFGDALTLRIGAKREEETAKFNYDFNGLGNQFTNFSGLLSLRYSPRSKSMMTPAGKYTFDSKFPQLFVNIEKGMKTLGGELDFAKIDFLYLNQHKTKIGTTSYRIFGGFSTSETPIWHQFTMSGLSDNQQKLNFNFTSFLGFATMEAGKYYGDKFAGLYISHRIPWYFRTFGRQLSSLDVVYRTAISDMKNPEFHQFNFSKMNHLYQETGVEWNHFLSTRFNLGFFYRVGYYHTPNFIDNFAIQFKYIALEF